MEKQQLNRFVSKYNLAGLVESVKWESKEGSLTTAFISDDKSVLGSVTMKEFEGTDTTECMVVNKPEEKKFTPQIPMM